jgi:hypothetical protein
MGSPTLSLERALGLGFKDVNLINNDRSMDSLRSDPRWPQVVARVAEP